MSRQWTLALIHAVARMAAVCLCAWLPLGPAHSAGAPSPGASGMPGALGTIELKPKDWKGNVTTYWKDTDGIHPGIAGCHVGVTASGRRNGRFFGEACESKRVLIESNPGAGVVHAHAHDLGHPDTFDCKAWCMGTKGGHGGVCVKVSGPPPCTASARCQCN